MSHPRPGGRSKGRLSLSHLSSFRGPPQNVDLQFSRSDTANRDADKLRSQVSFLSGSPRAALEDLAVWAGARGMDASVGSYSDREFYLDAPDAFVDFVIEAMTPDLADYGVDVR